MFASLALVTLVPILVLGIYETRRWSRSQAEEADHQHSIVARAVGDQLALLLAANANAVQSVSNQVRLLDSIDPALVQPILDTGRLNHPTTTIFVADPTLTSVAASPTTFEGRRAAGRYYGDRKYIQHALATSGVAFSALEMGRLTQRPNLHVGVAMRRPDGSLLGVVGAALDLEMIDQVAVRSASVVPRLQLIVVDDSGTVVIHPDHAKQARMPDLSGIALVAPVSGDEPEIREVVDDVGIPVRAAVRTLHDGNVAWTVAVYRPVSALEAEATATAHTLLVVALIILLGTFALSAAVAAWLAAPLVRLAAFVARGRGGSVAAPAPRRGEPREVADLIIATGAMMHRLDAQATELEGQVEERTAELVSVQRELAHAERLTSLGTLAAGIAHEINNPLTYVMSNLEHARETICSLVADVRGPEVGEVLVALDDAHEGAERVRVLVQDLRTYSQRDDRPVAPVMVSAVIESAGKLASSQLKNRARLITKLGHVPRAIAHESRLVQVLVNVIVNAAQAMPDAAPEHNEIVVESCVGADGRVAIAVRDNGCGIALVNLARVFDPFFTTKAVGVGTGLGLFVSHNLVRAMGGELLVESEVGRGSTFTIWLPAEPASETVASAVVETPIPTARRSILVIDDDPRIGKVIVRSLSGDDVTYEQTATAAIARITVGEHYDVILCDLMMPEMDGPRFYELLGERMPYLQDRIGFITGGAATPRTTAFLAALPNRFLEKPFAKAELLAFVSELEVRRGAHPSYRDSTGARSDELTATLAR